MGPSTPSRGTTHLQRMGADVSLLSNLIPHTCTNSENERNVRLRYNKNLYSLPSTNSSISENVNTKLKDILDLLNRAHQLPFHFVEHLLDSLRIRRQCSANRCLTTGTQKNLSYGILEEREIEADFMDIWTARDIAHGETEEYTNRVIPYLSKRSERCEGCKYVMRREIREVCIKHFPKRLEVICSLTDLSKVSQSDTQYAFQTELAIIHNSRECVKKLIEILGKDILCVAMSDAYEGVTPLHLAIAKGNDELVDIIISALKDNERQCCVEARARGRTFLEMFPFGERILHLAVYVGNPITIRLLTSKLHIDPTETDSYGNNPFHVLPRSLYAGSEIGKEIFQILCSVAVHRFDDDDQIYDRTSRSIENPDVMKLRSMLYSTNSAGFSPLKLACKYAKRELIESILSVKSVYCFMASDRINHDVVCYEGSELDPSLVDSGNVESGLEFLILSEEQSAMECFQIPPIAKLIDIRWSYSRPFLIMTGVIHIVFLIPLIIFGIDDLKRTAFIESCPDRNTTQCNFQETCHTGPLAENMFMGFVSVFSNILTFVEGLRTFGLVRKRKLLSSKVILLRLFARHNLNVLFCISFLAYFVMKLFCVSYRFVALSISFLIGWILMITLIRSFRVLSFFSEMFGRLLTTHLFHFSVVMAIIIIASCSSSRMLYCDPPNEFKSIWTGIIAFVKLAVGINEFAVLFHSDYPWLSVCYFVAFVTLVNTLLFNMLIATMSDTYNQYYQNQDTLCTYQRAKELVVIEWISPAWLNRVLLKSVRQSKIQFGFSKDSIRMKNVFLIDAKKIS